MKSFLANLVILFLVVLSSKAHAQDTTAVEEEPYVYTEKLPEYPGGAEALYKFFDKNIEVPINLDKEGTTYIKFTLDSTGMPTNFRIENSLHEDLDNEIFRVLGLMPQWIPGKQNGKPVAVEFTVPIKISLKENRRKKKKRNKK